MIDNIVILRFFRNYFMELKNSGVANSFELKILATLFPLINADNSYFTESDPNKDKLNLLYLMKQVADKLASAERGKVIELYTTFL